MFWNKKEKIDSAEYLELKKSMSELKHRMDYLELDLQMYVKKLKPRKVLAKQEEEESKDINSNVLLPI
jgi:hypothetical protein